MDKVINRKRNIDLKTWILVGCAAVALVIVVVVILVMSQTSKIDSSYFHTDENKIVMTMDQEMANFDQSMYEPPITHIVYYINGEKVVDERVFYEYRDEETAARALPELEMGDFATDKRRSGRFVVFQVKREQFEGLLAEEVREYVELYTESDALILGYNEDTINNYYVIYPWEMTKEELEMYKSSIEEDDADDFDDNSDDSDDYDNEEESDGDVWDEEIEESSEYYSEDSYDDEEED